MAIKLPSGFSVTTTEAIDSRLVLTKEQMLNTKKALMPNIYICICSEDKKIYVYDKSITTENLNPETGRFRPLEDYLTFASTESKDNINSIIATGIKESPQVQEALSETIQKVRLDGGEISGVVEQTSIGDR